MATPRVCVLRAPGTNCDVETAFAFETCGARVDCVHLFRLLEQPGSLDDFQIVCIPGGFSYGDDVGAGVIFARQLRDHLTEALAEFLAAEKLLLGICNGFQVLLKSGILPGGAATWEPTDPQQDAQRTSTLTWNDNGKYTALWVKLAAENSNSVFLRGINEIELPIAHAEGKLAVSNNRIVDSWFENRQVALRYASDNNNGSPNSAATDLPFPENPNGSVANIAALSDPSGRILGMMPHPERFIHATQHPQWTRRELRGEGDGIQLFRNAVEFFS